MGVGGVTLPKYLWGPIPLALPAPQNVWGTSSISTKLGSEWSTRRKWEIRIIYQRDAKNTEFIFSSACVDGREPLDSYRREQVRIAKKKPASVRLFAVDLTTSVQRAVGQARTQTQSP
jgi:hypothetical protein